MKNNKIKRKHEIKSWYQDRYLASLYHRNILVVICGILLIGLLVTLIVVKTVIEKNAIEPYVISVSKTDEMPVAVKMSAVREYANANLAVIEYFLTQYINAREGYNPATYTYNYNILTRTMSKQNVFNAFYSFIQNDKMSPLKMQQGRIIIEVVIKQMTTDPKTQISIFRIARRLMNSDATQVQSVSNIKITMHYIFDISNLTYRDLTMNPLGIKIDSYDMIEERTLIDDEVILNNQNNNQSIKR